MACIDRYLLPQRIPTADSPQWEKAFYVRRYQSASFHASNNLTNLTYAEKDKYYVPSNNVHS